MRAGIIFKLITAALVVVGAVYYFKSESDKSAVAATRFKIARAVEQLPPGTEDAWLAYVEKRFGERIRLVDGVVYVQGAADRSLQQTTIVSRNSPFHISCNPIFGASVEFAVGFKTVTVPIYRLLDADDQKAPPLEVVATSIAGEKLSKKLCERISALMIPIMAKASY